MVDAMSRETPKVRRMWDSHGSWVLLVVIGVSCFMAGSQFNAASTSETVRILVESYERQDALRTARIRELHEENRRLSQRLADRADSVIEQAKTAAEKAAEAAAAIKQSQPIQQ